MLALAALVALAAPAAGWAGLYVANQQEIGAAMELSGDGRFKYEFAYGAISEVGQGRWSREGDLLVLTSDPMPRAPAYVLLSDKSLPKGQLRAQVVEPQSPYFDNLDVVVATMDKPAEPIRIGKTETVAISKTGATTIIPLVPILGSTGGKFTLSADRGHALELKFMPNDLDKARFERERLKIDHGDLLLTRYDVIVRFKKAKP